MTAPRTTTMLARTGAALLALTLFGACGSSGGSDAADTTTAGAGATTTTAASGDGGASGDAVTIKGFAFDPKALKVKVGDKVTFTNEDPATHTATADDDSFNTKSLKKGAAMTVTFDKAGTITYHCDIHPTMTAEVDVT